jgi:hypothetical protein
MTYKWFECSDMCYSLFVLEKGKEYNFGYISKKNKIDFQCYPNNSEGTEIDDLRKQNFKVALLRFQQVILNL